MDSLYLCCIRAYHQTFGATVFVTYAGFWLSFAIINIPWFGIQAAYAGAPDQLENAVGLYLCGWAVVTFIFLVGSLKSSVALVGIFFFLHLTFWLMAAAALEQSAALNKAGGATGLVSAIEPERSLKIRSRLLLDTGLSPPVSIHRTRPTSPYLRAILGAKH